MSNSPLSSLPQPNYANSSLLPVIRIAVVGDSGVGKSIILRKLCYTKPTPTHFFDFGVHLDLCYHIHHPTAQQYDNNPTIPQPELFLVEFLDLPGHKRYQETRASLFNDKIDAVMLFFDARHTRSEKSVPRWYNELASLHQQRSCFTLTTTAASDQTPTAGLTIFPLFLVGTVVSNLTPFEYSWVKSLPFSDLIFLDVNTVEEYVDVGPDATMTSSPAFNQYAAKQHRAIVSECKTRVGIGFDGNNSEGDDNDDRSLGGLQSTSCLNTSEFELQQKDSQHNNNGTCKEHPFLTLQSLLSEFIDNIITSKKALGLGSLNNAHMNTNNSNTQPHTMHSQHNTHIVHPHHSHDFPHSHHLMIHNLNMNANGHINTSLNNNINNTNQHNNVNLYDYQDNREYYNDNDSLY